LSTAKKQLRNGEPQARCNVVNKKENAHTGRHTTTDIEEKGKSFLGMKLQMMKEQWWPENPDMVP